MSRLVAEQISAADCTVMTIMQWFNDVGASSGTQTSDILQDIEDDKIHWRSKL